MDKTFHEIPASSIELEVIACSLDDAMEAYRGGASRLEVTVRLDEGGLTPPLDMVREILRSVPLPIRVMLRDRPDFSVGGDAQLESLKRKAAEFATLSVVPKLNNRIGCSGDPATAGSPKSRRSENDAMAKVEGLVTGHLNDGRLDLAALDGIISAAPNLRVTVHHAIEATCDPLETLRSLQRYPSVDRALVSGGAGSIKERIDWLVCMQEAFGHGRSLIAGGNVTLDMLKPLREAAGIHIFHLGRAIRTPEESTGGVDSAKVRMAAELLGLR